MACRQFGAKNFHTKKHLNPESKGHGANMGPTWVLSAPGGTHVDPMTLAIRENTVSLIASITTISGSLANESLIRLKRENKTQETL